MKCFCVPVAGVAFIHLMECFIPFQHLSILYSGGFIRKYFSETDFHERNFSKWHINTNPRIQLIQALSRAIRLPF
eukprot:UN07495